MRAYGHDLLPDYDRNVEIYLHVAVLPTKLPKETIQDVLKQAGTTGSHLKQLLLGVPDDGMSFDQLEALLASSSGTDAVSWPRMTADQILWEQLQNERGRMSEKLNVFKHSAADFQILRSALATPAEKAEHEVSGKEQATVPTDHGLCMHAA